MVEEETAKRIEELVKKRVEEELEKRKEEIEAEVFRRVEEAKKIMERQMMAEMERRREQQLEEEKKREVRQKGNSLGVESWVGGAMCDGLMSVSWEDIRKLYVLKLQFAVPLLF